MKMTQVIVHDCNPGTDPQHVLEQLRVAGLGGERLGIEFDACQKRKVGPDLPVGGEHKRDYQPCAISRDRQHRVPVIDHIEAFRKSGFYGPFSIDFIDRRAVNPILKVLAAGGEGGGLLSQTLLQVPEIALMYKTPWAHASGQYNVEPEWRAAWPRICINSRFPTLVREFLVQDQPINLFWEPVDLAEYRHGLKEIIADRRVATVVYKIPHLTHSAKFDPDGCLQRDLDFFNSVPHEMRVIPLGSVEQIRARAHELLPECRAPKQRPDTPSLFDGFGPPPPAGPQPSA